MEVDPRILERLLRDIIAEATLDAPLEVADKWANGTLVFQPRDDSLQSHEIPIRTFFKKVTAVREKLRLLEAKINGNADLSPEDKMALQGYLSRCYGSLTSFNFLFKRSEDKFRSS